MFSIQYFEIITPRRYIQSVLSIVYKMFFAQPEDNRDDAILKPHHALPCESVASHVSQEIRIVLQVQEKAAPQCRWVLGTNHEIIML